MNKTISAIADRMLFSVFSVTVSSAQGKNLQKNVADALVTQYPQALDDKNLLTVKTGGDKTKRIVFVAGKNKGAIFGEALSSTLLTLVLCKGMSGSFVFIGDTFVEYITIQNGLLVTSAAKKRIPGTPVYEQAAAFPAEPKGVICPRSIAEELRRNNYGGKTYDIEDITERQKKQASFAKYTAGYKRKQWFSFAGIALLVLFLSGMGLYQYRKNYAAEDNKERQLQEQQKLAAQMRAEQERRLQLLRTEYDVSTRNKLPSAYFVCGVIFSCIEPKTKIENLSIAGYTFHLDAMGLDAIKTLAEFEKNVNIQSIQLSRTVIEENREIFSFSGAIKRVVLYPDTNLPAADQIAFYEEENQRKQNAVLAKKERSPSDYSDAMRALILSHNCQIQSIQYYGTEHGLEIDCTIRTRSVSFFGFLKAAADETAGFDIASIRIRNFPDANMISAVIRFRTGIVIAEQEDSIFPFQIDMDSLDAITPNEMSRFFANPVRPPAVSRRPVVQAAPPAAAAPPPVQPSFLLYIGTATSNGNLYVMFKDTRTDRILKLPFNLEEKNHVRYSDTGSFLVTYEGSEYEVAR